VVGVVVEVDVEVEVEVEREVEVDVEALVAGLEADVEELKGLRVVVSGVEVVAAAAVVVLVAGPFAQPAVAPRMARAKATRNTVSALLVRKVAGDTGIRRNQTARPS
jgi:hypothetical protein